MASTISNKVAVVGLDRSGQAACKLLRNKGAAVSALPLDRPELSQKEASDLAKLGVGLIGPQDFASRAFDLVVHSSSVPRDLPLLQSASIPEGKLVSDLELAFQSLNCLNIGVSGTNGKTTTAELIEAILKGAGRNPVRAGGSGQGACEIADASREADYAILEINSFQLESIEHYRPAIAVLLNLKPDHMDRYDRMPVYVKTMARLFANQQAFDWAVIQSEALAHIRSLNIPIRSKIITFSSSSRRADLFLDRGLLISGMHGWAGPLLDMDHCHLKGPHHAENIMAALAVGRILRLPLEEMAESVRAYRPGPHRLEPVKEIDGVRFINNSKAVNPAALEQSIQALPARGSEANIWLIAGGKDKGLEYHDLGPLLANRVKGAFLLGETRENLRAAWGLFTPCATVDSLLEAVSKAFENATAGDVVLLSPGCSSFDMFQNYQHRGESFRNAVEQLQPQKRENDAENKTEPPINRQAR
jgi:UDP-N-acetylmuramoylalanine--D-glutamate ligase